MVIRFLAQVFLVPIRSKCFYTFAKLVYTSFLNSLNFSNDSDLCLIRYTYPYLLKSPVNVMMYRKHPFACTFSGPHTSLCIKPNKLLTLSLCPVKGTFVILPNKQDSYTSYDLKSNESKIPSLWSLNMRFSFMWAKRQC